MKIAIVHDYIKEYGGAERVLEALHELYPKAPIYTSLYLPNFLGPHKQRFKTWDIHTSWLQYIPFKQKLISPLRLLSPWAFEQFDFSSFDVIISSATGAYFPNTLDKKDAFLICYCHTPPRYLYGYATAREWKKNVFGKILGTLANHFLRMVDFDASRNVDAYIANSKEVESRIKKFYRKNATVIYPPVDTAFSKLASSDQLKNKKLSTSKLDARSYYVAGGRLARPKHIDLLVKTALEMKVPLKVFGKSFAGYGEDLTVLAKSKGSRAESLIEFVGEVSDTEKWELMEHAKAFLFAAEDEDFGITPVEAMAAGIPVVAYRSGGVQESVIDGKTGVFYEALTVEGVKNAIKRLEKLKIKAEDCRRQADTFSKERFIQEIKSFVQNSKKDDK